MRPFPVLTALALLAPLSVGCENGEAAIPPLPEFDIVRPDAPVEEPAIWPAERRYWYGVEVLDIEVDPAELKRLLDNWRDVVSELEADARVTFAGLTTGGVTLELHGGAARMHPKKSYRLTFPDDLKPELEVFGDKTEEHRRLVLRANWIDPTSLRDKLLMDLPRALGDMAPRAGFVAVAINGEVQGLFSVVERIDRIFLKRHGLDPDANVYKAVSPNAYWGYAEDPMAGFEVKVNDDHPTDDLAALRSALTNTPATFQAFEAELAPLMDLPEFMRWQMVNVFALNTDGFVKNYYLYHDVEEAPGTPEARWRLISWDADTIFGINWKGDPVDLEQDDWRGEDQFSARLFSIDEYLAAYAYMFRDALDSIMHPDVLIPWVKSHAEEIAAAGQADLDMWERGLSYEDEVEKLYDAIRVRHEVMSQAVAQILAQLPD